MSANLNRGGWRLDDTNDVYGLYVQSLCHIERMCGGDEEAVLRKVRTLAYWLTSTAESAYGRDPEAEAMAALDADLARVMAQHGKGEGDGHRDGDL